MEISRQESKQEPGFSLVDEGYYYRPPTKVKIKKELEQDSCKTGSGYGR